MRKILFLLVFLAVSSSFLLGFFSAVLLNNVFNPVILPPAGGQGLAVLPAVSKLEATTFIAAVDPNGNGSLNRAEVEIIDGKGRVLFNTNPFVEPDTQQSLENAARAAFSFTGKSMAGKDVIFSVTNTPAQLIGGPSAGGAFAVSTVAAIEGKKVKTDVAMTGTIDPQGNVGPIGGVIEKASAAAGQGMKLFLVPAGQTKVNYYKEVVEEQKRGFVTIRRVRLVPQQIDLNEYAKENNLDIEIREISTLKEAVDLMLESAA